MLIALFADIHANRQAFEACLADARDRGASRFVLLGDLVGYGADPAWTVTAVMGLVAGGAIAVIGNHDDAIAHPSERMNVDAKAAIDWTRGQLSAEQRAFLAALPMAVQDESRLYVHAGAAKPEAWGYITGTAEARDSLAATPAHITFCGHVHKPALYALSFAGKVNVSVPEPGVPAPMPPGHRWVCVCGAVGQPRDGNPAAAYTLLDTDKKQITFCRVPYDVAEAAARIRAAGLPSWLADRLLTGE